MSNHAETATVVARVLNAIASPPNLRDARRPGDLEGEFDQWFDGGAIRTVTGTVTYAFDDGVTALVGVLPWLFVTVTCADGTVVSIREKRANE